ncbi:MAG TPA: hypothetical protein D7I06_03590 [Candidatus Poseidoniales archaeon]|nr:MAG TPA: hypothetical protein D7I06_03590 [Candidatus Poseidoniales archaeon]HII62672.1 hypothetical protein [Candidatus Poseidoniaceae archaeon]|tara:strand:- start:334 stop:2277 length:1944 start_codon:yes stop_codon:yes gene_type:complete
MGYDQLLKCQGKILTNRFRIIELDKLNGYRLNFSRLTKNERKLIKKFVRQKIHIEEITPRFLMEQLPNKLISSARFGRNSDATLTSLQHKIRDFFDGVPELSRFLMSETHGHNMSLLEIGQDLLEDIEFFANTQPPKEKCIFLKRSGLGEDQLTLEELGNQFGVTRERIRQKEQRLLLDLHNSIRVAPGVLNAKIHETPITSVIAEMVDFRRAFSTDVACIRMLARLAGIDSKKLFQQHVPPISQTALDDFFCSTRPPFSKYDAQLFLQEEFNLEVNVAKQALTMLQKQGQLGIEGQIVYPQNAKKEVAIAYLLAKHPDGLDWIEVARKVNQLGLCRSQLSIERPDSILHTSSYIFQSGRSQYSHMCYFGLSKENIRHWLAKIRTALEQSAYSAMNLRAEYYETCDSPKPDYYRIRHVVRNFGVQAKIYFNGHSQTDTVSLEPVVSLVSQMEAIARILEVQPMTIGAVAGHIHSQSEGHAWAYLCALISEGRVVRLDDSTFAAPSIAFSGINTEKIIEIIHSILAGDSRVHHIGVLSSQINRGTKVDLSPRLCKSLITAYAKQEKWCTRGYLVAKKPFEWTGLSDVVRDASDVQGEDLIAWVQQRVCASREVIKRAICNSGTRLAEAEKYSYSEGLAADLMQELFEL